MRYLLFKNIFLHFRQEKLLTKNVPFYGSETENSPWFETPNGLQLSKVPICFQGGCLLFSPLSSLELFVVLGSNNGRKKADDKCQWFHWTGIRHVSFLCDHVPLHVP